jgi:hypothetical protein
MKGTRHRMKEVREIAEKEGLVIDEIVPGPHYKFYVRNQVGVKRMVVVGSSTSDRAIHHLVRNTFRKIAKETAA